MVTIVNILFDLECGGGKEEDQVVLVQSCSSHLFSDWSVSWSGWAEVADALEMSPAELHRFHLAGAP